MKQRILVRAIVRREGKTLLLRRANGRATILGKYELPGGRVFQGEQPEDALRRYMHDDAGLHIQTVQLYDAVTYTDHDDRDIQYVVIVYLVAPASGHHSITLSANYDKYAWNTLTKIQQEDVTDLTALLLGILRQQWDTLDEVTTPNEGDVNKTTRYDATVFSDGGSRGNPGPSAAGFVILDQNQQVIEQGGEYIGITTNNQAEYHGVRLGLERALALGLRRIDFRVDSMLVVNQMNGVFTVKNRELWPIHERIRQLVKEFELVRFSHVKREFNQLADGMVNKTLDQQARERARGILEAGSSSDDRLSS